MIYSVTAEKLFDKYLHFVSQMTLINIFPFQMFADLISHGGQSATCQDVCFDKHLTSISQMNLINIFPFEMLTGLISCNCLKLLLMTVF